MKHTDDTDGTEYASCEIPTPKDQRAPSSRTSGPLEIRNDREKGRFVADVGGAQAFIDYRYEADDTLHLIRTWVPNEARGTGVGSILARFALDHAREVGLRVATSCWFIDRFIDETPDYQDLRS